LSVSPSLSLPRLLPLRRGWLLPILGVGLNRTARIQELSAAIPTNVRWNEVNDPQLDMMEIAAGCGRS
jgi:hypothetical protein